MKSVLRIFVVVTIFLSGCVSVKYSPIPLDSPMPEVESCEKNKTGMTNAYQVHPLCVCKEDKAGDLHSLKEGESCIFPIRANKPLTLTPLAVSEGERYRVSVSRNQVWYDASRHNIAPDGEPGSRLMRLFNGWRKSCADWFALIVANVSRDGKQQYSDQDVSKKSEFNVERLGRLAFYPNDALMPDHIVDYASTWRNVVFPRPGDFYFNNSGQVWVRIERCAKTCE
ncbi:MAG: hypothetical protein ACOY3V_06200 [Pseudomonadota bacterium]